MGGRGTCGRKEDGESGSRGWRGPLLGSLAVSEAQELPWGVQHPACRAPGTRSSCLPRMGLPLHAEDAAIENTKLASL